jgi:transposase-like protein
LSGRFGGELTQHLGYPTGAPKHESSQRDQRQDAPDRRRLALPNITATWERAAPIWRQAMNQFAILYGDRFLPPTT